MLMADSDHPRSTGSKGREGLSEAQLRDLRRTWWAEIGETNAREQAEFENWLRDFIKWNRYNSDSGMY
jgi:hypothetical protein